MAWSHRPLIAGLLASCALLSGCPETGTSRVTPAATPNNTQPIFNANQQKIDGELLGPASLGSGGKIGGTAENAGATADLAASPEAAATGAAGLRVLQASSVELPVENADITIKSYEWKVVTQMLTKRTDDVGKFYFNYVPAKVAFFLEATYTVGKKKYFMLGLTRTGEIGEVTKVKIDVASTLVARLILRLWHISNRQVDFETLDPRDYKPLLDNLRTVLKTGMPAGVTLDLNRVGQPVGDFRYDDLGLPSDRKDSAIVALDQLAAKNTQIDRDVDRLYKAVNKLFVGKEDGPIKRPPKLN